MKKLILFLMVAIMSLAANAQNILALGDGNLTYKYTGVAADTASYATVWSKIITPNSTFSLWYNGAVKVTEVSASTGTTIVLAGRMFDTDAWTDITTKTYTGAGSDTTVTFQEITTKKTWNQYRIAVDPTTGKLLVNFVKFSFRK